MKPSKRAKTIANDLGLSEIDAAVMELKSSLYIQAAKGIQKSKFTHEEIARRVGTSRARISRISRMGENSLSIELLVRILYVLENKIPLKVA